MKSLVLFAFAASCALAVPIQVQILSGTVTIPGGTYPSGLTATFNLTTNTGSLTGFSGAGAAYQDLSAGQPLPYTFNPSLLFGGATASMTIVHNGTSYSFEPRDIGSSPDNMNSGAFTVLARPTLTATGPLTVVVPFSAALSLSENFQFNAATQQDFIYSGSGTATLNFTRFQVPTGPGAPEEFRVRFAGGTFAFETPEPGSAATVLGGLGLLAIAARRRSR